MYTRRFFPIFNPWQEMDRLQREMNRMTVGINRSFVNRAYPAMNVWSNPDTTIVTTELAGYEPADINVSVAERTLSLSGERKPLEAKEGETIHRQERASGKFQRSLELPYLIDSNSVVAQFNNGVLNIVLPRAEADKPRKIAIKQ